MTHPAPAVVIRSHVYSPLRTGRLDVVVNARPKSEPVDPTRLTSSYRPPTTDRSSGRGLRPKRIGIRTISKQRPYVSSPVRHVTGRLIVSPSVYKRIVLRV